MQQRTEDFAGATPELSIPYNQVYQCNDKDDLEKVYDNFFQSLIVRSINATRIEDIKENFNTLSIPYSQVYQCNSCLFYTLFINKLQVQISFFLKITINANSHIPQFIIF